MEDIRPAPPLTPEEVELEGYAGKSVALVESILRNMYKGVRPLVRVQLRTSRSPPRDCSLSSTARSCGRSGI
ncbi:hypothetical protein [Nannocystis pusilla]|uniref:hypothetical protein n=1 Tax=Nannocystis pusilla TaxID=889268 RepID=UPI003B8227F2